VSEVAEAVAPATVEAQPMPETPPAALSKQGLPPDACVETSPSTESTAASTDEAAPSGSQETAATDAASSLSPAAAQHFFIGEDDEDEAAHEEPAHLASVPEVPDEGAQASASSSSASNVIVQPRVSNLGRRWTQYKLPSSEGKWWSCDDTSGDHFIEESPMNWRRYHDPSRPRDRGIYWWNEETQEWFYPL